jgi:hypothetical protein
MVQFEQLPDSWKELGYDTGPSRGSGPYTEEFEATWASEDEQVLIHSHHSVDSDGTVTYPVVVEQHLAGDGFKTEIQSHAKIGDDRREAESLAVQFMEEVDQGLHKLRVLGVQEPDQNDFIQFFTLSDSELPGDMTGEQLIHVINSDEYGSDIDDLPDEISRELANDEMIQVDVFPRHKDKVKRTEDDT